MRSYLVLLFCLPLPFGANVVWAWGLFAAVIFALLGIELFKLGKNQQLQKLDSIALPPAFIAAKPVLLALGAVQVLVLLQWLMTSGFQHGHDVYLSLLQGCALVGFFALSLLLIRNRDDIRRVVWTMILAAGFQAIYGAFMVLSGLEYGFFIKKEAYLGKATGTFINRNHLAGYLEMAIALGIGLLLASSTRYRGDWRQRLRQSIEMLLSPKVLARLLLAIMVIALVLTRSRMGNTAFFASLMLTGLLALLLMKNKSRSTTLLLSSLLVIDIAIVGTFFGVEKVADRIQNSSTESESRDEVTAATLETWQEHPLLGIGAGGFYYSYPSFRYAEHKSELTTRYAHNDYVQFLAEFGLIAFLLLLGSVLYCLWCGIQAMRQRNSSLHQGMGFASCMGLIAIAIHSTVDFNLQIPANAFVFMLLMAMALIARHGSYRASSKA